jgi:hypothetical protein
MKQELVHMFFYEPLLFILKIEENQGKFIPNQSLFGRLMANRPKLPKLVKAASDLCKNK